MTSTDTSLTQPATAEAASRYQRLRGHLAALKLHAAAEALPTVMDQAAAEQLSLTAALERLLAIEVDATEARPLAGRLRFASLPTPATLAGFDVDAAAGVDRKFIDELATCRYLESATNILLVGPPGTGKTHLAVGLARAAAHAGYRTYSPPPPIWLPAATARRSRVAGPPPCGSTLDRRCWPSMSSGICRCLTRRRPRCFRLSPNDI
jgi:DNA replication protein DnaC